MRELIEKDFELASQSMHTDKKHAKKLEKEILGVANQPGCLSLYNWRGFFNSLEEVEIYPMEVL